ncbi:MarR family winged helix-turn-helix transcriptional regulator [Roseisalinus antarcticus]|uniref:Transcriptional regulator SlyA n=1 Tax=Roseisalinus antarcticus TaxID=254357 RepID=A0A1Y5SYQ8_9RHOB|nr:MarR family winged helix-turn-helix transcriptional regulator [Roseisalinus antarcticus]SLN51831.1 transcriptional regulator SlyA [Roseisalinus antarcticus]
MEHRPPPIQMRDGQRLLDLDRYVPYFLVAVTNAISRGASRVYLDRFGVGIMEWRVMTTLAIEPGCAARRICRVIHLDKSAVSRSLASLEARGLARPQAERSDPRRKSWTLTAAGRDIHDRILTIALERESRLLEGVPEADVEVFLTVMRRILANVAELQANP